MNGDASTAIHFIYDRQGRVIAEMDAATGAALREYIYVNGQQVALVDDSGTAEEAVYYVHNDHLGTPQKITDANQAEVWAADYEPFGQAEVTTEEIVYNVRFPGQYADEESGLHYNYFRDYDPSLGRYVESDPIGLDGGLNTYSYTLQNPIIYSDPTGEKILPFIICTAVSVASDIYIFEKGTTLMEDTLEITENLVERIEERISDASCPADEKRELVKIKERNEKKILRIRDERRKLLSTAVTDSIKMTIVCFTLDKFGNKIRLGKNAGDIF